MHYVRLLLLAIVSAKETITWPLIELSLRSSISNAKLGFRTTLNIATHRMAVPFLLYRSSSSLSLLLLMRTFVRAATPSFVMELEYKCSFSHAEVLSCRGRMRALQFESTHHLRIYDFQSAMFLWFRYDAAAHLTESVKDHHSY